MVRRNIKMAIVTKVNINQMYFQEKEHISGLMDLIILEILKMVKGMGKVDGNQINPLKPINMRDSINKIRNQDTANINGRITQFMKVIFGMI